MFAAIPSPGFKGFSIKVEVRCRLLFGDFNSQ